MASEENKERFYDTLLELAGQIKLNADSINILDVLSTIELILQVYNSNNRIFVYGAGRSGFIGRCFAQRLMHLGIKSCFVSDAVTYRYSSKDLLVIISGSGETTSPVAIAKKAKEIGGKVVLLSSKPKSTIGELSDYTIEIKGKSKDVALDQQTLAPYTSLFDISAFAVVDSIGGVLMEKLGVTEEDIDNRHASIE
ncbi:MAG: SIS domain-containing protein [Candidatus Lokiarchaeota archaeon]|nr:SIS domain-containing protein [Candidatus Lokiarchaeota archaeon]